MFVAKAKSLYALDGDVGSVWVAPLCALAAFLLASLEGFGFFTSPPSFINSFEDGDERLPSCNLNEINGVKLN